MKKTEIVDSADKGFGILEFEHFEHPEGFKMDDFLASMFDVLPEQKEKEKTAEDDSQGSLLDVYFSSIQDLSPLSRKEEVAAGRRIQGNIDKIIRISRKTLMFKQVKKALDRSFSAMKNKQEYKKIILVKKFLYELEKTLNVCLIGGNGKEIAKRNILFKKKTGLSLFEAKIMWKKIKQYKAEMEIIRNKMVSCNLRLVAIIAKKYLNRGVSFLDIIQEGNVGLMKAAERFDPEMGCKFSTYSVWWIHQNIRRAIMDQSKIIRLPVHRMEFLNKVIATISQMKLENSEDDINQIAKKIKVPKKEVEDVLLESRSVLSLQNSVGSDEDRTLIDFVKDNNGQMFFLEMEKKQTAEIVEEFLKKQLNFQEYRVIKMRFGIGGFTDHTLEEVGAKFNLTRESIRQIEKKALQKLIKEAAGEKKIMELAQLMNY